ncbi:unnamed protein product [Phyllotreta striolata]|uniref:C2H2-type domain-containing protein n=1 Tax=Phyllotreta striolata TaxID=444603 RepID=A0A9N9XHV8_PHYSR|nr:unnamed protein product [Phyllotreta striolata]
MAKTRRSIHLKNVCENTATSTKVQTCLEKSSIKRLEQMYKLKQNQEKHKSPNKKAIELKPVIYKENDVEMVTLSEFPEFKMKIVKAGGLPFACQKCLKCFKTKVEFESHISSHTAQTIHQSKPRVRKFACETCSKTFVHSNDLKRHNKRHTGEKNAKCTICNKLFMHSYNLNKHMLQHLQIKPFVCEICNKQFGAKYVLKRHILVHSTQKPFKCSLCDKRFIRQEQLNNHLKKKHSNVSSLSLKLKVEEPEPEPESCSSMNLLSTIHKIFECEICNKQFKKNTSYKNHLSQHSKKKSFKCSNCKKVFNKEGLLKNHLQICQDTDTNSSVTVKCEETIEDFFKENIQYA